MMNCMKGQYGGLREHLGGPQLGLGGRDGPPRQRERYTEAQRETETETEREPGELWGRGLD